MSKKLHRRIRSTLIILTTLALAFTAQVAQSARVGILSNEKSAETAANFALNITGHTFTAIDVGVGAPRLDTLTAQFDVLLLFEEGTFAQSTQVGNTVAAFAKTGRPVVLGAFYDQDRTDARVELMPHGWGDLETIDPNTTDGVGTPYAPRSLGMEVAHPLTIGVTTLTSAKFAGGQQAKPSTIVVANWAQPNAKGNSDPAIAYAINGAACVIHIAIAPDYPIVGVPNTDFSGDFYRVWSNAFDFAGGHCVTGIRNLGDQAFAIPAVAPIGLLLLAVLIAAVGVIYHRRGCANTLSDAT